MLHLGIGLPNPTHRRGTDAAARSRVVSHFPYGAHCRLLRWITGQVGGVLAHTLDTILILQHEVSSRTHRGTEALDLAGACFLARQRVGKCCSAVWPLGTEVLQLAEDSGHAIIQFAVLKEGVDVDPPC